MGTSTYDIIIVGGGIAGTVVASRIHEQLPKLSIILIEAGQDVSNHPLVKDISKAAHFAGSELDWNFSTVPQKHLNGRTLPNNAGKALGGGSAINGCRSSSPELPVSGICVTKPALHGSGGWIRGDASDYDLWARLVKDSKWSYLGLLPYFRKIENYHTTDVESKEHGFAGPIRTQSTSSTKRDFPLRDPVRAAWASAGVAHIADANTGHPRGLGELIENRDDGVRQVTSSVYPLSGIEVKTGTHVHRILFDEVGRRQVAKGIQLSDGTVVLALKEIVLSAGAYSTPQILLLSGIGPTEELRGHKINTIVDSPGVGKNLWDHMAVSQWWKLRNPQDGLAMGSPNFFKANYAKGYPLDWVVTQSVPRPGLKKALTMDKDNVDDDHPLLTPERSFTESLVVYVGASAQNPSIPLDGSHVTSTVLSLLPTSRGSVTLATDDPATPPLIDPNYNATETDRYVMRTGLRKIMEALLDTKEGQAIITSETVGSGFKSLNTTSSDDQLDERIRAGGK